MHLDLLVLKITDVFTEGALDWAVLSLKKISVHLKIPPKKKMNSWFVVVIANFLKIHAIQKFQLKHNLWQFWKRGIGQCQGGANDPGT